MLFARNTRVCVLSCSLKFSLSFFEEIACFSIWYATAIDTSWKACWLAGWLAIAVVLLNCFSYRCISTQFCLHFCYLSPSRLTIRNHKHRYYAFSDFTITLFLFWFLRAFFILLTLTSQLSLVLHAHAFYYMVILLLLFSFYHFSWVIALITF